jgi:hypothetical protein
VTCQIISGPQHLLGDDSAWVNEESYAKEGDRASYAHGKGFVFVPGLRKGVSPPVTQTATGRSTAHTKCRNEVEDLKRSAKLCGRAVVDNENKAGGCGLVLGSILPGTPAFFGFILGLIIGFLVTSAVLYIANSRGNDLASREESHETEDNIDRGYKSTSKQNRDAG